MRVLSIVCLSAYAAAKTIPAKDGALRINLEKAPSKSPSADKKKSKKTKKKNGTPVETLHAAPKPEYPQGQVSSPIQYIDPNDIDTSFGQFAKKMQHPAYLNSETMLREMIEKGKKMGREDLAAKFAEKLNLPKEEKRLQCFECSGNSYEECYRQGQKRTCGSTETSCMLEVRFQGSVNSKNGPEVRQVRSGCQQKVACINNMKQNFWEIDGNKVNLADSHMHNCKIFSQTEDVSVCRNCCFKDNCTKDWQPKNYEDWVFEEQKKVKQEAMLFDQFANPPDHWMKSAEERFAKRVEYFSNLEDLNKAPTLKKDSKKSKKSKPEKDEKPFNPVINLKKPAYKPITTTKRSPTTTRRTPTTRKAAPAPRFGPGSRPNVAGGRYQAPKPTQKPTTQKPTTKKPADKVPDDFFFALLNSIKKEATPTTTKAPKTTPKDDKKKLKKQKPDEMRFALNVDEDGNVHKTYQKMAEKKNSKAAEERFVGVMGGLRNTPATTTTKRVMTTAATSQKGGPLAHLPPWQQRKIRLQRKKLLEEQVAKGNKAAKVALEKLLKIIEQDKLEVARNQAQAVRTTVRSTVTQMPKLAKKSSEKSSKNSKTKKAQPQMMKFSQWEHPESPEAKILEPEANKDKQIVTVTSELSDEEFSKMLENIEPENFLEKKEISDEDFFSMVDFLG